MTSPSIPVDLFNPGQVFACLGLMEIAEALFGGAAGRFDDENPRDVRFELSAEGCKDPIDASLDWLAHAELAVLDPPETQGSDPTRFEYPCPPQKSDATLPVALRGSGVRLTIAYWCDATSRPSFKLWGGQQKGPKLAQAILDTLRSQPVDRSAPFSQWSIDCPSFRFDTRSATTQINDGFSPNVNEVTKFRRYPLVEILAALALSHARPREETTRDYRYSVITHRPVALPLHRAGLGGHLPFHSRSFRIQLAPLSKGDKAPLSCTETSAK